MPTKKKINAVLSKFKEQQHEFSRFGDTIAKAFLEDPKLKSIVHSVRTRIKDEGHIKNKIIRKYSKSITTRNYSKKITDLVGVRVLHLHPHQFKEIHRCIKEKFKTGEWVEHEPPKAYTWDPESKRDFERLGLETTLKESLYTSIHYVVRPRKNSDITCEIQVRTLLEETWGEIDHLINYPEKTKFLACAEKLSVFARLVGTGRRLADAIMIVHENEKKRILRKKRR